MTEGDYRVSLQRTLRTEIPHGKGPERPEVEVAWQVFDPLQLLLVFGYQVTVSEGCGNLQGKNESPQVSNWKISLGIRRVSSEERLTGM